MLCVIVGLLVFAFFLHINFLSVGTDELVLQESQTLVGDDADAPSIVELPTTMHGNETLIDVGGHKGMHMQAELADAEVFAYDANLAF